MVRLRLRLRVRVRLRVMVRVRIRVMVSDRGMLVLEKKNIYEFHEILLCETHMCFSGMIRCCWTYVTV